MEHRAVPSPRRLLLVFDQYRTGGVETHLDALTRGLVQLGLEVFCAGGPDFASSPVHSLVRSCLTVEMRSFTGKAVRGSAARIADLIAREGIEVVHLHGFRSLLPGALGALLAEVPYIVTFHGFLDPAVLDSAFGGFLLQSAARFVLPHAARLSAVSEETRERVAERFDYPRERIFIGRNPIEADRFDGPAECLPTQPLALLVSRLDQDKFESVRAGLALVASLRRIDHRWKLKIAGTGRRERDLRECAAERGLHDAEFLGARSDVDMLMGQATVVIGMGRVILEAVSIGRLAILSGVDGLVGQVDCANFERFLLQNFNGRGIPAADPNAVAAVVTATLSEAGRASTQLRSLVHQYFSADQICADWLQHYASVKGSGQGGKCLAQPVLDWLGRIGPRSLRSVPWTVELPWRTSDPLSGTASRPAAALREHGPAEKREEREAAEIRVAEIESELLEARRTRSLALEGCRRYAIAFDDQLAIYRSQRAWKAMLWLRKAYTIAAQRPALAVPRVVWFALKTLLGQPVDIEDQELWFPSLFAYLPARMTDSFTAQPDREPQHPSPDGTLGLPRPEK